MNKTAKIRTLCNLVEVELATYVTAIEQITMDKVSDYLGHDKLSIAEYIFARLLAFHDIRFYPDSDYIDTERDKIEADCKNEIAKVQVLLDKADDNDKPELQDKLAQLNKRLERQNEDGMIEYRRDNMLIARDTLRYFWENKNGDIAHNWELFSNLHYLVLDPMYKCYNDAKMKLPAGNPALLSKPDRDSPDENEKKSGKRGK